MITRIQIHSTNFESGRAGQKIEAVVVHIMQGTLLGTDTHFKTYRPGAESSSHEGIGKNGDVHVYVEPQDTAYHAGRMNQPTWPLIKKNWLGNTLNPNPYTYGIECEGFRGDRWTEEQMKSLVERTRLFLQTSGLSFERKRIISHHEISIDKENMNEWCDEVVKRLNTVQTIDRESLKKDAGQHLVDAAKIISKL